MNHLHRLADFKRAFKQFARCSGNDLECKRSAKGIFVLRKKMLKKSCSLDLIVLIFMLFNYGISDAQNNTTPSDSAQWTFDGKNYGGTVMEYYSQGGNFYWKGDSAVLRITFDKLPIKSGTYHLFSTGEHPSDDTIQAKTAAFLQLTFNDDAYGNLIYYKCLEHRPYHFNPPSDTIQCLKVIVSEEGKVFIGFKDVMLIRYDNHTGKHLFGKTSGSAFIKQR